MKRFLLMFVGTMLLSLSAYAQTGGVKGKVVSRDGREAISGVAISVDGVAVNTTTNEDGEFIIEGLAPGQYNMTFEALDFEELSLMVRIKEMVHDMQNVVMIPVTAHIVDNSAFAELDTDVESAGDSNAMPSALSAS
jgi:hypothetical protein